MCVCVCRCEWGPAYLSLEGYKHRSVSTEHDTQHRAANNKPCSLRLLKSNRKQYFSLIRDHPAMLAALKLGCVVASTTLIHRFSILGLDASHLHISYPSCNSARHCLEIRAHTKRVTHRA